MDLNETLNQLINEEKSPEQIETEHKDTAEWFANALITKLNPGDRKEVRDYALDLVKKLLPEYFKKIVGDHQKEFKNYYIWLVWMEDQMKKFDTPEKFIESLKK